MHGIFEPIVQAYLAAAFSNMDCLSRATLCELWSPGVAMLQRNLENDYTPALLLCLVECVMSSRPHLHLDARSPFHAAIVRYGVIPAGATVRNKQVWWYQAYDVQAGCGAPHAVMCSMVCTEIWDHPNSLLLDASRVHGVPRADNGYDAEDVVTLDTALRVFAATRMMAVRLGGTMTARPLGQYMKLVDLKPWSRLSTDELRSILGDLETCAHAQVDSRHCPTYFLSL